MWQQAMFRSNSGATMKKKTNEDQQKVVKRRKGGYQKPEADSWLSHSRDDDPLDILMREEEEVEHNI